jgi:VWFA-related protein
MTGGRSSKRLGLVICLALFAAAGPAQQNKKQDIPDAPSAVRPAQPLPSAPPPSSRPETPTQPTDQLPPPPAIGPAPRSDNTNSPPPFNVKTVPEGGAAPDQPQALSQDLYRIVTNVNQVMVPVTVKDESGRLVSGLASKDFQVLENGVKQNMNFFTDSPFALSAAVILDFGMPDTAIQKINQTFPALEGAFSQYDEVSLYTYGGNVSKMTDFTAVGKKLTATLNDLKLARGRNNGPAVTSGPFGPQGPVINGVPTDPGAPVVSTPPRESHVLNDAILAAALDLGKRDKTRRKIIFIISEGREYRSSASYRDVMKVLLTNGILVYGIGVEGAAIPVYGKLQKLHLPGQGTGNILPKYASATGGEVFTEFSREAIESVYARVIGDARNQYTLGYATRSTPSSAYREIEVKVAKPDCADYSAPCVRVYARGGYYPLPPGR